MADGLILNFGAQRNEDYMRVWKFRAQGETEGLDVSSWEVVMRFNTATGIGSILSLSQVATANGSVISLEDGTDGQVSIFISKDDIAALPGRATDVVPFAYNLIATSDGGTRAHVRGQFIVEPGV